MTKIHDLYSLGQSIWLDYINRAFILEGKFKELLDLGLTGMTSNPTIFEKAIVNSNAYDLQFEELVRQGKDGLEIYSALVCEDIKIAADTLLPVYEKTSGRDGYVSLEVNPLLAQDTNSTVNEALALWEMVNCPNLMIKIPATKQGLPAITQVISAGINVNVTLIFSITRYKEVIQAFFAGLENRLKAGYSISSIHSVASFFVSRLDTKIDRILEEMVVGNDLKSLECDSLKGKSAVANARIAYQLFSNEFSSERFRSLEKYGANIQRPLWASTSTKNPSYSDILYIQELIGPHTVNTATQETIKAFLDHGKPERTIDNSVDQANKLFADLANIGIDMDKITWELEREGVDLFSGSFNSLILNLDKKKANFYSR
jgi:transaldolase